jgi:hypothetical protein
MLDLIIGLDSMQREQEAEAKERLMAELRATDAFAAPADHTDYQPEGE